MLFVGLDDTDTLDHPGTNQLARHLAVTAGDGFGARLVVRYQLLVDPRVPCTRKNGCAAIMFDRSPDANVAAFIDDLKSKIVAWCPTGSDPGLCVTEKVPLDVVSFSQRCQSELVTQAEARKLAKEHDLFLEGLGGTEDGVIGAMAAVGLMAAQTSGRVVYRRLAGTDIHDMSGCYLIEELLSESLDHVVRFDTGAAVKSGIVDLGKRLRPNYRAGQIVLFVAPADAETKSPAQWRALRVI